MSPAKRLTPPIAPPPLRLLERPPRLAPRTPAPAERGFWERWTEVIRQPR